MKEIVCRITGKTLRGPVQFCTECGKPELLRTNYCSNCGMPMSHPATCSCDLCLCKTEQTELPAKDAVLEKFRRQFESNAASIATPQERKKTELIDHIEKLYQQLKQGDDLFKMTKLGFDDSPAYTLRANSCGRGVSLKRWSFIHREQSAGEEISVGPETLSSIMDSMEVWLGRGYTWAKASHDLESTSLTMEFGGDVDRKVYRLLFDDGTGERILIAEWGFSKSAPERNPQEISSMGPLKILTDHSLENAEMWFIPLNDGSRLEVVPRADPQEKCWDYGLWFNQNGSLFELGRWGTGLNGNKGFRPIKTGWGSLRSFLVGILVDGFMHGPFQFLKATKTDPKDPSKCWPPCTEGSVPATNGADLFFKRSIEDDRDSFGLYIRRTENNVPVTRLVVSWVFDQGGNLLRIEGPE